MSAPYRIHMPHWPEPPFEEPEGTMHTRMRELLWRLGNPQDRLPPTIHVAGTNGKGSTIAFLRAFLESASYRVHVYTSPHLHRFEERIRVAGQLVSPEALHLLLERCRAACGDDLRMKFFEGTTAAAMLAFAEIPADILLVETGMGGREDPTNLLSIAAATILTPIGLDHVEYLGPSLEHIAWHKAGILKAGVPCIVGPQSAGALAVIEAEAEKIGAPLLVFGRHWAAQKLEAEGQDCLRYADAHGEALLPLPNLPGAHQIVNAGMAIAALTLLDDFEISAEAVEDGLQEAEWPARLERIRTGKLAAMLPEHTELWVDGGHNEGGAAAIAAHMAEAWQDRPTHLIFGTTRGKALAPMLLHLLPLVASAHAVPVQAEPKGYGPEEITAQAEAAGLVMTHAASVAEAVQAILQTGAPARILVFGSLYLRVEVLH